MHMPYSIPLPLDEPDVRIKEWLNTIATLGTGQGINYLVPKKETVRESMGTPKLSFSEYRATEPNHRIKTTHSLIIDIPDRPILRVIDIHAYRKLQAQRTRLFPGHRFGAAPKRFDPKPIPNDPTKFRPMTPGLFDFAEITPGIVYYKL